MTCHTWHVTHDTWLNWTELNWTELNWTELNWTELKWTELNWNALLCTAMHCTAQQFISLHFSVKHCPKLRVSQKIWVQCTLRAGPPIPWLQCEHLPIKEKKKMQQQSEKLQQLHYQIYKVTVSLQLGNNTHRRNGSTYCLVNLCHPQQQTISLLILKTQKCLKYSLQEEYFQL